MGYSYTFLLLLYVYQFLPGTNSSCQKSSSVVSAILEHNSWCLIRGFLESFSESLLMPEVWRQVILFERLKRNPPQLRPKTAGREAKQKMTKGNDIDCSAFIFICLHLAVIFSGFVYWVIIQPLKEMLWGQSEYTISFTFLFFAPL